MNLKKSILILIVFSILLLGCVEEPKFSEEIVGVPVQVDIYTRSFNSADTVVIRFEDGRIVNFIYSSATKLPTLNKINRIKYYKGCIEDITVMEKR